jgi:hypothetical protein
LMVQLQCIASLQVYEVIKNTISASGMTRTIQLGAYDSSVSMNEALSAFNLLLQQFSATVLAAFYSTLTQCHAPQIHCAHTPWMICSGFLRMFFQAAAPPSPCYLRQSLPASMDRWGSSTRRLQQQWLQAVLAALWWPRWSSCKWCWQQQMARQWPMEVSPPVIQISVALHVHASH